MKPHCQSPGSDNDGTINPPMSDAPDTTTVVAMHDGHQGIPGAYLSIEGGDEARNARVFRD